MKKNINKIENRKYHVDNYVYELLLGNYETLEERLAILSNKAFIAHDYDMDSLSIEDINALKRRAGDVIIENGLIFSDDKKFVLGFAEGGFVEHLVIPEGVERICIDAFTGQKIKSVQFPKSLKIIENSAFYCEDSVLEEVEFNDGLEIIGYGSFQNTKLKKVLLPNSVKVVEEYAFEGCRYLEELVFSKGMVTIKYNSFNSTGLKKVVIPSNIRFIDIGAFMDSDLEEVVFNEGLDEIEDESFLCNNLKNIKVQKGSEWIIEDLKTMFYENEKKIEFNRINFEII